MLSPFVLLAALVFPEVKLSQITLAGIGISAFIEIFQTIIPGRVPDLTDLLANTVSVLIGAIFVAIVKKASQLR